MAQSTCPRGGEHAVEVATPIDKKDPLFMYGGWTFRARCIKCGRSIVAKKEKDFDEHII
jgi:hypothetical protein